MVPEVLREHLLGEVGDAFDDKTVSLWLPGDRLCVFRLLHDFINTFRIANVFRIKVAIGWNCSSCSSLCSTLIALLQILFNINDYLPSLISHPFIPEHHFKNLSFFSFPSTDSERCSTANNNIKNILDAQSGSNN